jgi:DNA-binding winged helix-turn-helix (wHTH) protein
MTTFASAVRRLTFALPAGPSGIGIDDDVVAAETQTPLLQPAPAAGMDASDRPLPAEPIRLLGGLLDVSARAIVGEDGTPRFLTRKEFAFLHYLSLREGAVVEREELLREVWGMRYTGSNVIEALVASLRRKLGVRVARLQTVRGFGYRLQRRASIRVLSHQAFLTEFS